jgi:hypothetical protein
MITSCHYSTAMSRRLKCIACVVCSAFALACFTASAQANDKPQIASVVQRGNFAYGYNEKGSQIFVISAGDGLAGFTQSSVSIRRGNFIYIYDSKGRQTGVVPAGRN